MCKWLHQHSLAASILLHLSTWAHQFASFLANIHYRSPHPYSVCCIWKQDWKCHIRDDRSWAWRSQRERKSPSMEETKCFCKNTLCMPEIFANGRTPSQKNVRKQMQGKLEMLNLVLVCLTGGTIRSIPNITKIGLVPWFSEIVLFISNQSSDAS